MKPKPTKVFEGPAAVATRLLPAACCLLPVVWCLAPFAMGCTPKEDPAGFFAAAERAYAAGDCVEAVLQYQKAASWGYQTAHAQERIKLCQERLALKAARGLEKKHAVPIPDAGTAPAPRTMAVSTGGSSGGSLTRCDPAWREKIVTLQGELSPLEKRLAELSQKTSAVESKYPVKKTGDGYDFSLPADTPKDKVGEFQNVTAKEYAKTKGEQNAIKARIDEVKARISAVEADADKARVLRECLYPPPKGF